MDLDKHKEMKQNEGSATLTKTEQKVAPKTKKKFKGKEHGALRTHYRLLHPSKVAAVRHAQGRRMNAVIREQNIKAILKAEKKAERAVVAKLKSKRKMRKKTIQKFMRANR